MGDSHAEKDLAEKDQKEWEEETQETKLEVLYGVDDVPSWYLCLLLGVQHFLTMIGTTISIPFVVASIICMEPDDPARGYLVSTIIFVSGIITFLQATVGVRLPIVQGGNFAYFLPSLAILNATYGPCDSLNIANMTEIEKEEVWQVRLRAIQGNIAMSSIFQILLGFTGAIGVLLKWITPLTIVPTVALVGLSLFDLAAEKSALHWGISIPATAVLVLLSQYMKEVSIPVPTRYSRDRGITYSNFQLFKMFSILIVLVGTWIICWLLTTYDVLTPGSAARTDLTTTLVEKTPWFRIPYPGQWGLPTGSVAGVLGMLAAGLASIIESVGDYYACARISGAPPPPVHAINRGVGIEGVGVAVAGIWGTGSGTNSYSQNIAAIAVTRVGSRRVVQVSAMLMILGGVFCKFGALCSTIPEPVIASLFWVMFAMIAAVGFSTLQFVDLNSSRNLFVLGFSVFFSLSVSKWMKAHPQAIQIGVPILDQTLSVLLQTTMFVGCLLGCFLDNTIPGTDRERGLTKWRSLVLSRTGTNTPCYDMPFGMESIKRMDWLKYIPFSPTFRGYSCRNRGKVSPNP